MSEPRESDRFWDDEELTAEDIERGTANRLKVLEELINHAYRSNEPLDAARVAKWHKDCLSGLSYVSNADECFLGAYRGSRHPRLKELRVGVRGRKGVVKEGAAPEKVKEEVDKFFRQLRKGMNDLAGTIESDRDKTREELLRIVEVTGWAHGEWVRIHPFANGSGRAARLIANWVLVRFGLPPVIGIRPRPEHPYGPAAEASMDGDHSKITRFILKLLEDPPAPS